MNTPSERAGWSRAELAKALFKAFTLANNNIRDFDRLDLSAVDWDEWWRSDASMPLSGPGFVKKWMSVADAIMALAPPSSVDGNQGVMADRCDGTDTEATTSPSSAGSVAGQGGGSRA